MATQTKVTREQAERVLALFAEVIGERFGETIPTGKNAAYKGLGPELVMEWTWPGRPCVAIVLEGGISDEIEAVFGDDGYGIGNLTLVGTVQRRADAEKLGVFLETYASYAVTINADPGR